MSWAAVGILTGVQYMRVLVAVKQGHKYEMYSLISMRPIYYFDT